MNAGQQNTSMARRAREIYDAEGEEAMLAYIRWRRRQPQSAAQDFQGYALLEDGSAVLIANRRYCFGDQDRRDAAASAGPLADTFAQHPGMYRGWPRTNNLWHQAMRLLEDDVLDCPDDGQDPALEETW